MPFVFQGVSSSGELAEASDVLGEGMQLGEINGLCFSHLPDEFLLLVFVLKQLKLERNCERLALM